MSIEDIEFSYIEGFFGQIEQEISQDEMDFDISIIEEIASNLYFETPNLRFTVDNAIGVPFLIDLDLLGINDDENIPLNGPNIQAQGLMSSFTDFNNSNSQLSDMISISPTQILYSGAVLSNPNGNIGVINSITAGSDIKIGFELDLPLHFRLEDAKRTDTLDIDFGGQYVDLTEVDYLDSVIFKLHTENEFPLDIDLMILFTDSMSGLILDSLDIEILDAAQVDEDGRTMSANIYDSNIILNHAQIDALFNSNRALLDIKMNSHDNENSAVKLYTDYQFNISAGAIFELNID